MAKVIDISELISLVCDKLIEYGVQPHTVWSDYSYNYRPILHFFQEHGCSHYDEGLLMQYRQEQQERYEREDLLRKNYLTEPLPAKAIIQTLKPGLFHACRNFTEEETYPTLWQEDTQKSISIMPTKAC